MLRVYIRERLWWSTALGEPVTGGPTDLQTSTPLDLGPPSQSTQCWFLLGLIGHHMFSIVFKVEKWIHKLYNTSG